MKKALALILLLAMMVSMAACTQPMMETTPETEPEPEVYVPSDAVAVEVAYMDGYAKVVTRKNSEKEISKISIACVYFDGDGKQLGKMELIECPVTAKDKVSNWTFNAPNGCAYLQAAIAGVSYADGTKEECPGITTWAEETAEKFDSEKYQEKLEEKAALAEECDLIAVDFVESGNADLKLQLKNIGEKDIREMVVYTLWYDDQGNPVEAGGSFARNAKRSSLEDLKVEEEAIYTIPAVEGATTARLLVQMITFTDDSVWANENTYFWIGARLATAP